MFFNCISMFSLVQNCAAGDTFALLHSCTSWFLFFCGAARHFQHQALCCLWNSKCSGPQPLPYINPVPVQWTAATALFGAARFPFWPTFLVNASSQAIRSIIRAFFILPVPQSCPDSTLSSQATILSAQRDPRATKYLPCLLFLLQAAQQMDLACSRAGRSSSGAQKWPGMVLKDLQVHAEHIPAIIAWNKRMDIKGSDTSGDSVGRQGYWIV